MSKSRTDVPPQWKGGGLDSRVNHLLEEEKEPNYDYPVENTYC